MRVFVMRWLIALLLVPLGLHAQTNDADTTSSVPEATTPFGWGMPLGEGGLAGGWKWPLDDIKRFGDDGFTGWIRINVHPPSVPVVSILFLAGGTFFGSQSEPVFVSGGGTTFPAKRSTRRKNLSSDLISHCGLI